MVSVGFKSIALIGASYLSLADGKDITLRVKHFDCLHFNISNQDCLLVGAYQAVSELV